VEGELGQFRAVVESLADEFDLMDIALGAIKMGHEASLGGSDDDQEEIPEAHFAPDRGRRERPDKRSGGRQERGRASSSGGGPHGQLPNVTRLYISLGRNAKIRPKDLVGAITGEAGIRGNQIGSIQIAQRFSIVEVASDVADQVMDALRAGSVKGKKVKVSPERER
jgi:ATP-dependent RNA helicase DeaD